MNIKKVVLLGANGTMGQNVAGIFASFGNATVYAVSRTKEKSEEAIEKAILSVKSDGIRKNLIAKDYTDLKECVENADLIFESVAEIFEVKRDIWSEAAKYMKPDTICCTGTSGLSIEKLSMTVPEKIRERFCGMHFFNPPYNLNLCELIPSSVTDVTFLNELKKYATEILYRNVVVVTDTPGFLGNRIGFQFINSAIQYAEKYKEQGGIDYIDAILGGPTGRSMAPIVTADFVGLDIHKSIVDYLYENTNDFVHDTFYLPKFADSLVAEGKLGRKSGEGFYKTVSDENGKKVFMVYDILSQKYRKTKKYDFPFMREMRGFIENGEYENAFRSLLESGDEEANICIQFLMMYVIYAVVINSFVGTKTTDADDAMTSGFNWCPPLGIVQALGGKEKFKKIVETRADSTILEIVENYQVWDLLTESEYDFRKYIKA